MAGPERVVFDCNVFLQALISAQGPAARCFEAAQSGRVALFYSQEVLAELTDVARRPKIVQRFGVTDEAVEIFTELIEGAGTLVENVQQVFHYPRDPKDAHYVDLAVAVSANLVVSRDKDLLALNDPGTPEREALAQLGCDLLVVTPVGLLERLEKPSDAE
ncbi:MAG: putative toxin-antitoxin system toxin component, PIN family [Planctomycetaceae bacterium]|nr:putative toxin-antitoxin system toxin component, PIN family [Planctomycetaceae bacterium]